jgi:hypothetical protein
VNNVIGGDKGCHSLKESRCWIWSLMMLNLGVMAPGIPVLGRIGIVCMMNNAGLIVIPVVAGPVMNVR